MPSPLKARSHDSHLSYIEQSEFVPLTPASILFSNVLPLSLESNSFSMSTLLALGAHPSIYSFIQHLLKFSAVSELVLGARKNLNHQELDDLAEKKTDQKHKLQCIMKGA